MIRTLKKELKEIKYDELDIGLKALKQRKETNVDHLYAFIMERKKGTYQKSWIEEKAGMTNMNRYWKHEKIVALVNEGKIRIYGKEIVVLR